MCKKILILLLALTVLVEKGWSQDSLLEDLSGDGLIGYMGFGDSITFGVGDESAAGGGYLRRLSELLGIITVNRGVPGEELLTAGVFRFPNEARIFNDDVIGVMESTNDAIRRATSTQIRRALQRIVNVARALGKEVIVLAPPTPCCDRSGIAPFVDSYYSSIVEFAAHNDIRLADINRAWRTTCQDPGACELYNLPEGLHPNSAGYDVMAQTVAAALLGIDIFAIDGAATLEAALGLPAGTVIVKPGV